MSQMLTITVDPGNVFRRELTALEQKKLPWATMRAVNRTADRIRQAWADKVDAVFDRPVNLTRRAIIVKKARYLRNDTGARSPEPALVYVRDQAANGTPPARYLLPQVVGGSRRATGLERGLQRAGILAAGQRAIPGAGAPLDGLGNIRRGVVKRILSQLRGRAGNDTDIRRQRRRTRTARPGERGGAYFAVRGSGQRGWTVNKDGSSRASHLRPGVYERVQTGFGTGIRSIYTFVNTASYRTRYTIFGYAQAEWDRRFPGIFRDELHTAVMDSLFRGRT